MPSKIEGANLGLYYEPTKGNEDAVKPLLATILGGLLEIRGGKLSLSDRR